MENIVKSLRLLRPLRSLIIANVVIAAIVGALNAFLPLSIKLILDQLIKALANGAEQLTLSQIIVGPLLLWLVLRAVLILAEYIHELVWDRLMPRAIATLREATWVGALNLSLDHYEKIRVGEITHLTITAPIEFVPDFLREMSEVILPKVTSIIIALFLISKVSMPAAIITFIAFSILLVINYRKFKITKPMRRVRNEHLKELTGYMNEGYSLVRHLYAMGSLQARTTYARKKSGDIIATADMLHGVERRYNIIFGAINLAVFFSVFLLVIDQIIKGNQSPAVIPLIAVYLNLFTESVVAFSRSLGKAADVEATQRQVHELLAKESTITDKPNALGLESIETIEFKNVNFSYQKNEALKDVSFTVEKGQKLALIGMSGAGKTTITKLLLRFYDVDSGQLLINGRDIKEYKQLDVRRCFGTVLQDVALFNDTVEENIRMVRPEAGDNEVAKAAKLAHATEFIESLPDGYKTMVGERGIKLSGGQQQRIAIARAILRKPSAVILDEATSALDTESERAVQSGIKELLEDKLSVVIAHRLSTIRDADIIIVLDKGKVIEADNHKGLLKRQGYYAKLLKLQST